MTDDLLKDLVGLEHHDASVTTKAVLEGDKVQLKVSADISAVLEQNERDRAEASRLNLTPDFDNEGFVHLGRIPRIMVDIWRTEGFDLMSAEKSGMTPEEHWAEILKRLSGDYSKFNVSKYRRL